MWEGGGQGSDFTPYSRSLAWLCGDLSWEEREKKGGMERERESEGGGSHLKGRGECGAWGFREGEGG